MKGENRGDIYNPEGIIQSPAPMRVNNWGDIYKYMSMREKNKHKHNQNVLPRRG